VSYAVKEIFYSLQGEGARSGRAAVFCRFAGCNLWSGREEDRAAASCTFCDTDFVGLDGSGGGRFEGPGALAEAVAAHWPRTSGRPYVILTGGEPALQVDRPLIDALHDRGFEVAVETNGTLPLPEGLDWICLSPKGRVPVVLDRADELKLVYPQAAVSPERWQDFPAEHHFLQPLDDPARDSNLRAAADYCLRHPQWRLSLQTHKLIGIR